MTERHCLKCPKIKILKVQKKKKKKKKKTIPTLISEWVQKILASEVASSNTVDNVTLSVNKNVTLAYIKFNKNDTWH